MTLEQCIESIINSYESKKQFDSHDVIEDLRRDFRSVYNSSCPAKMEENQYHGMIARIIQKMTNVELLKHGEKSTNVNGNETPNAVWRKI